MTKFLGGLASSGVVERLSVVIRVVDEAEELAQTSVPEGTALIAGPRARGECLDEITRALRLPFAWLPDQIRRDIEAFMRHDPLLEGRQIAIIDDDVRNIFSLTSVLEQHQAQVLYAENGRDGIELVRANPDLDAVLVDVMMPELDGYEVMRQIRATKRFARLPLIAVTAKAMKEDRDRCFEAGASEYLAKPVDVDELLSVLRTCLQAAD